MSATDQPVSPEQQAAIHGLLVKMREAWERGDGTAYASLFTRDARYVSATGTRSIGPEAIATTHQQIFDSLFSATRLGNSYPAELQPVAPGVILIHATGAVLFPGEHEQTVAPNGLLTILATNTNDGWKIASFANTPTGKARNPRFFLRYLRSRLRAFQTESRKAKAHMLRQKQANIARWSK
ncbi:MAG TPA: SgcJ/EcaC family oxidoreductase [Solirubrobacteraceae bacterium]|nr:SgcJ/EcaC family oxidoreductase [Solirubrobacteraceae bacterium]